MKELILEERSVYCVFLAVFAGIFGYIYDNTGALRLVSYPVVCYIPFGDYPFGAVCEKPYTGSVCNGGDSCSAGNL